jgi:hypothetical protein
MSLQNVHLRINDAATGRPTPVRLRVTDAAGIYYAPFGRVTESYPTAKENHGGDLFLNADRWTYIDGACEIAVPPGALTVEACKGPEYHPLRETVHLPAGKLALRFTIERWTSLRAEGWHSGDTSAFWPTPHAALLEGAAEDLAVVNLLARENVSTDCGGQRHVSYPHLLAFSGQVPCLERDGHSVVVNTQNEHAKLGHVALLHCHRIVFPLAFGGPDGSDGWSLADWCDQCHRKRGLVVWTDAVFDHFGHQPPDEVLADLILGKVDAFQLDRHHKHQLRYWYLLQSAGIPVPLVGGSQKSGSNTPLGALRTYARLAEGEQYSYKAWIEAIRAGRTFVTARPILRFSADGHGPGDVVRLAAGAPPVPMQASAASAGSFSRVDVVVNGEVVSSGRESVSLEHPLPTGGWAAARCWGEGRDELLAQTSPVYFRVDDSPPSVDAAALNSIWRFLDRGRNWVEHFGRFKSDKARNHLLGIFAAARQSLLARPGASSTIDTPAPPA